MKGFTMIRAKELICFTAVLMGLTSCQNDSAIIEKAVEASSSNVIIGNDDRRLSTESLNKSFYQKVGQFRTKIKYGDSGIEKVSICSAALISKNFLITAAHCVYQSKTNDLLKNTFFYPGIDGVKNFDKGRYPVVGVYHPADYDNENSEARSDIAIVELGTSGDGKSAGGIVGYHGYWGKDTFPAGETLTLGYPGDKPDAKQFFQSGCHIENESEQSLVMDCDVKPGQSGSPIFVYNSEHDNFYIHGVVTSGNEYYKENYGSFVTKERQDIIRNIIKENFSKQNEFEEKWIKKEIKQDLVVRIVVKNTCHSKDALFALNYKNLNNEWVTEGFYTVKAGESFEAARSPNGIYYIHARDNNRNVILSGDRRKFVPGSDYFNFKKYFTQKYGDTIVNIPCH